MPYNPSEFGHPPKDEPSPFAPAADAIVSALVASNQAKQVPTPVQPSYVDDVDRRIDVAKHYRMLCEMSLFSHASEAAVTVDNEVREFCRQRLRSLMGMGNGPTNVDGKPLFDDKEVAGLKELLKINASEVAALRAVAAATLGIKGPGLPPAQEPEPVSPAPTPTKPGVRVRQVRPAAQEAARVQEQEPQYEDEFEQEPVPTPPPRRRRQAVQASTTIPMPKGVAFEAISSSTAAETAARAAAGLGGKLATAVIAAGGGIGTGS